MTTFARACPVSLSREPLSPGIEATPKTDLSLSRSLVHRQTWRLTGSVILLVISFQIVAFRVFGTLQNKTYNYGRARSAKRVSTDIH